MEESCRQCIEMGNVSEDTLIYFQGVSFTCQTMAISCGEEIPIIQESQSNGSVEQVLFPSSLIKVKDIPDAHQDWTSHEVSLGSELQGRGDKVMRHTCTL